MTAARDPGPQEVERVMEALVHEHLLDLVDFDRMFSLERVLYEQLERLFDNGQLGDVPETALATRAGEIFARAWHRVLEDPRRFVEVVSREWQPDDDCELCRALAAVEPTEPSSPPRSVS